MSRVIKFRAWHKKDKWTEDGADFYIRADGVIFEPAKRTFDTPNTEIECSDDLILMQFTGLTDVNGVEIYEGHIIECNDSRIAQVEFFSGCFSVIVKSVYADRHADAMPICSFESLRVIGNIYQHSHLLDADK